jgi:hypothetical protein
MRQGPFTVTVPEELSGTFVVRMGLFEPHSGQRALLEGRDNGERSYMVGTLIVTADKVEFQPAEGSGSDLLVRSPFTRGENGWAEDLHPMDRFIKNTCEILGPLNEITSRTQMTGHEFLSADRAVRRTTFGEGSSRVGVVVNVGAAPFQCSSPSGGTVLLPANGFLVESPTFVAFLASSWNGQQYEVPAMFAVRSLDGRPITRSHRVRVYHAFGSDKIRLGKSTFTVAREGIVDATRD